MMAVFVLMLIALICGVVTLVINFQVIAQNSLNSEELLHAEIQWNHHSHSIADGVGISDVETHSIAGLSCDEHGGPSNEIASEMVYWKDIPRDESFISPYKDFGPKVKYLTVEPDEGFWNNKRMAIESAIALAVATGRILVLPPKQSLIYEEIFHFSAAAEEGSAFQVISTEEFLKREALTGNLRDGQGNVAYPPENKRTNWDGDMRLWWDGNPLWPYLRSVTTQINWNPDTCVGFIPKNPGLDGVLNAQEVWRELTKENIHESVRIEQYTNNPIPVDSDTFARLREARATRSDICIYDEIMQKSKYLHAMGDNASGARFFGHFYAILFFEDWKDDLFIKRFVRDHFRYADDLQCAASRIIHEMRRIARRNSEIFEIDNPNGSFHSFHVRRGDFLAFQKGSQVDSEQIYKNIRSTINEGSTVFIATDERDKSFFDPLKAHYKTYFLDDFQHQLSGIPIEKYGMIDQLVASRGDVFIGLFYSTFTGYINRMRGYHAQKDRVPGHLDGIVRSYFYAERQFKYFLRQYRSLSMPYWKTEFASSWRDIDHDALPVENEAIF